MTTLIGGINQRCTVCGKLGPAKACITCAAKYGDRFDLNTPAGRFQARQEEQGSPLEKMNREITEMAEKREEWLRMLVDKLDRARAAVETGRYQDIADCVKGIERLAKKVK